jgi:hypothetical protein
MSREKTISTEKDTAAMRESSCAVVIASPFGVRDGKHFVGFTIPTHRQKYVLLAIDRWLFKEVKHILIGSIIILRARLVLP